MEKLYEISQSRKTLALHLLYCLLLVGAAILLMVFSDELSQACGSRIFRQCCFENPIFYELAGKVSLIFWGLFSLLIIFYIIRPYPLFYITSEGFWTRDFGLVKWDNVSEFFFSEVHFKKTVVFKVKNIDELNMSFQYKMTYKINKDFINDGLSINITNKYNVDEIYKKLKEHCPNED